MNRKGPQHIEEEERDALVNQATLDAFRREREQLNQELRVEAEKHTSLTKRCQQLRDENTRLQGEFSVLTSGTQAMFLYIEQQRFRKMGAAFWLCVAIALGFAVGALQRGSYGWAALNFVAFLFVWRGLYVEINAGPMVCAVILAVVTIKFA